MDIQSIGTFIKNSGGIAGILRTIIHGEKNVVGVDVGSYAVKIVWLQLEGKAYRLKAWGNIPLNFKAEMPPEERKFQTARLIKNFFAEKSIPLKMAATSVSGNSVIVRYVKLPKLSKQELKLTLSVEAEPFIPFDIKEVDLSCYILGDITEDGQKKMETVLVAAKKELIKDRVDIMTAAGLKTMIIDVDAFVLETLHTLCGIDTDTGAVLFINMGHKVTNLSIIDRGVTKVVRDIFIAGGTLEKAVLKVIEADIPKIEEFKRKSGILISAEEKEAALLEDDKNALLVSKAFSAVIRDLGVEVSRSVDFYLSQGAERSISKIILSGGSANLKNFAQFMSAEFKIPVEMLNPLSFLGKDAEQVPKDILPSLSIAAGLAVRKIGD